MQRRLIFLGGNGHCAARLGPARTASARFVSAGEIEPLDIVDAIYPGFEDRPRAADLDAFLATVLAKILEAAAPGGTTLLYGTGIGGLIALSLRARGELNQPLLLQAPILWGLERRWMPRMMRRFGVARALLRWLFAQGWFQRRFVRKQFEKPMPAELRDAFFAGYAHCPAAPDLFAWLTPTLLRELELQFAARPNAMRNVQVWWGGRDRVVGLQELAATEQALGVHWPVRQFPDWGHYPMIDEPEAWVRAISDVMANFERVSGPEGSQAR